MKVFFNYCLERKYIKVTPMENIKFLKAKRKMKDEITDIEFRALIKAINITIYSEYRDYTIIQLIFDTGMRLTETLNLKLEDIDVERRTILIPAEINKGKKDRYIADRCKNAVYGRHRTYWSSQRRGVYIKNHYIQRV